MTATNQDLSSSLQDYLETIWQLAASKKVVRVRDIALDREVKAASVTIALKRLADLGLVNYAQREYVELTEEGQREALRVVSRHRLLLRLLTEVLGMTAEQARADACSMEHALSDEAMERLVRFFEFVEGCPASSIVERFHDCPLSGEGPRACPGDCTKHPGARLRPAVEVSLFQLKPGQLATVRRVDALGPIRQRLLDLGLLPGTEVEFERSAPSGDPIWVRLQGSQVALRRKEAEAVFVERKEGGLK
jgi:DtxR family Mn-dependent transcriptional regulator